MPFTEHARATIRKSRLVAVFVAIGLAHGPLAAQERKPDIAPIEQRVEAFAVKLEAKRQELGVLGGAFVIAQGDRVVRLAAFGLRQENPPLPVTENTLFMLASASKQFTGMAVALAVGEGKMTLADHPSRFVPGFALKDAEANAKLAILDLLTHRTGLARSDFTFLYYPFTQAELFALAQRATPVAKLRERYIYQNTMYSLAGAAVGGAYGTTYERFMGERIFRPLGMNATTFAHADFLASADRAQGYAGTAAAGRKPSKPADATAIAPAGGMHTSIRDLGAWLRFLNAGGQTAALRVAPDAYAQVFKGHEHLGAGTDYGLGFNIFTHQGIVAAEHGGNLPGFSAQIVHVPARGLSLALLANQDSSGLAESARELFLDLVVKPELPAANAAPAPDKPPAAPPAPDTPSGPAIAADALIGTYFTGVNTTFSVARGDSGIVLLIPNVPPLVLRAIGVNHYDLVGGGGYSLRFAESQTMPGRIEVALHAPPGQTAAPIPGLKKDDDWMARARSQHAGPNAALIGFYASADQKLMLEIVPHRGALALNVPGEAPRTLTDAGDGAFRIEGRPETDRLEVKRAGNAIAGIALVEPSRRQELVSETAAGDGSQRAEAILDAAVAAAGGPALDRIATITATGVVRADAHGLEGRVEERIVPGRKAWSMSLGAFGKEVVMQMVLSERGGWSTWLDGARQQVKGKSLAALRLFAVPHPLYRWRQRFANVAFAREDTVNGEAAYVIQATAATLAPSRIYISKQTSLVLRVESPVYVGDDLLSSMATDYADHRAVAGVKLPFASSVEVALLNTVTFALERVVIDAPIDPKAFE